MTTNYNGYNIGLCFHPNGLIPPLKCSGITNKKVVIGHKNNLQYCLAL